MHPKGDAEKVKKTGHRGLADAGGECGFLGGWRIEKSWKRTTLWKNQSAYEIHTRTIQLFPTGSLSADGRIVPA